MIAATEPTTGLGALPWQAWAALAAVSLAGYLLTRLADYLADSLTCDPYTAYRRATAHRTTNGAPAMSHAYRFAVNVVGYGVESADDLGDRALAAMVPVIDAHCPVESHGRVTASGPRVTEVHVEFHAASDVEARAITREALAAIHNLPHDAERLHRLEGRRRVTVQQ